MKRSVTLTHRKLFAGLLGENGLDCAIVLEPSRGNLGAWFMGEDAFHEGPGKGRFIPVPEPFDRNNVYIVPAEGEIKKYSQCEPHPTDAFLFPVLDGEELKQICPSGRIGIINKYALDASLRDSIAQVCPGLELTDIGAGFDRIRALKSKEETEEVRESAAYAERILTFLPLALRSGVSERQAVCDIRYAFYQSGAHAEDMSQQIRISLTSLPQGAENAAGSYTWPGKILNEGDRINVSVTGFAPNGYAFALGRCFTLGKASDETLKAWDSAVKAQEAAAALIRPGKTIRQIQKACGKDDEDWICGIGLSRSEDIKDIPLEEGMTVAAGPAVKTGETDPYRCLDVYAVTADGCERLGNSSAKLVEL